MRRILFDVTRLFIRGSRFSPTGIDRVVLAYARWLLGRSDIALQPVVTVAGQVLAAPRALLADIVEGADAFNAAARGGSAETETWTSLVAALNANPRAAPALRAKSGIRQLPARALWHAAILGRGAWRLRPARVTAGDLYVNVSHTGLDHPGVLRPLADAGVRPVIMVHDLIPITHPEYCSPGARQRHIRRIGHILEFAAFVVLNSQSTARALTDYAEGRGRTPPPSKVAPLGLEADFLSRPDPLDASRPYFVAVGTLEARKNLAFLLALWRRLAERMGPAAPRLVLVGRRGWESESILDHLQRSDAVTALVHEVSDLQDHQLARLIAGAKALLGPSLAEGYDLPVIEAMSVRAPVIASDIPVHRELASAAKLLDPLDGPAWLEAIEAAVGMTARGPVFDGPRWEDHFAALADSPLGAA